MIALFSKNAYNFIMKYKFGNISGIYKPVIDVDHKITVYNTPVKAGFPSPADDYIDSELSLSDLIEHPLQTYILRIAGDSMKDFGIMDGSYVIVDSYPEAQSGDIILAVVNTEFTIKQLSIRSGKRFLVPGNEACPELEIKEDMDFEIRGVITCTFTRFVRRNQRRRR